MGREEDWAGCIGASGDCVLKIGLGMSNKKREKDFACLECVIIQSL